MYEICMEALCWHQHETVQYQSARWGRQVAKAMVKCPIMGSSKGSCFQSTVMALMVPDPWAVLEAASISRHIVVMRHA